MLLLVPGPARNVSRSPAPYSMIYRVPGVGDPLSIFPGCPVSARDALTAAPALLLRIASRLKQPKLSPCGDGSTLSECPPDPPPDPPPPKSLKMTRKADEDKLRFNATRLPMT